VLSAVNVPVWLFGGWGLEGAFLLE
jgi:hypothetical protein